MKRRSIGTRWPVIPMRRLYAWKITGGVLLGPLGLVGRTRRSIMIVVWSTVVGGLTANLAVTASVSWRSGTLSSCNITRTLMAHVHPCPRKILTREWVLN